MSTERRGHSRPKPAVTGSLFPENGRGAQDDMKGKKGRGGSRTPHTQQEPSSSFTTWQTARHTEPALPSPQQHIGSSSSHASSSNLPAVMNESAAPSANPQSLRDYFSTGEVPATTYTDQNFADIANLLKEAGHEYWGRDTAYIPGSAC
ncbi:hypothetical protein BU23DRAFT_601748 [Bimuria novae-zelandiae CBS 107.79]|uniref:Uncharacterized protein n=1 Tax=Bimuria novae-zelandiae CBS 107.79 TaxID=1447943 RepID=A0A6A5UVN2_9PLEO|nr:hypothetical protein BU23DRAFT_601748 [Bimuria novae-zelandiae CBS 107.79]